MWLAALGFPLTCKCTKKHAYTVQANKLNYYTNNLMIADQQLHGV